MLLKTVDSYEKIKKAYTLMDMAFTISMIFCKKEMSFEHILLRTILKKLNDPEINYEQIDELIISFGTFIENNIIHNASQKN